MGLLLIAFSLTLLPPLLLSVLAKDLALYPLLSAMGVMFGLGGILWFFARHQRKELHLHDGFVIVAGFWTLLSLVGALPFLMMELFIEMEQPLTLAQAVFESVSGFTTTGATVIVGLDNLPISILYYRQQLQWLGGLGVIVLAVAVLPMLGIGGMQLYRAETPGPMRDDKLTPRLEHTAKALLFIYLILTVACALSYWLAGMNSFDAVCHSYTTIATGGFSTHDASLGYYNQPQYNAVLIESICIFFMLLGSLNFALHFNAGRRLNLGLYWQDSQTRVFLYIVLGLTLLSTIMLWFYDRYDFWNSLRYAAFHVVSIITSTGYLTEGFADWPLFLPVVILCSGFIGGCVGSTTGGIRVIRVVLLYKQASREIMRLIHPNAVIAVKTGNKRVSDQVAQAVWGFAFLYMISFILLSFLFLLVGFEDKPGGLNGEDLVTAFAGVAATLNMTGPAIGSVAETFRGVNDAGLWVLSFAMLLGRLEIFTLLVLLTPAFWRR
jgi:trk system potassium uptake protein TrkH